MTSIRRGAFRLFRFAGITVFLHWSWFLVAAFEINGRERAYSSLTWNILEYLALFLIVLVHEYGHALACRQVGGTADQIVLWPLGGVAYVDPPPRPGAMLWSIAAGPLVNVVFLPILLVLFNLSRSWGWAETMPNLHWFLWTVFRINVGLLIFNLLPIYPLDGGQIFRSLLWFVVGRARSLLVAAVVGFIGVAGFVVLAVWMQSIWFGILGAFLLMNCWGGLRQARLLARLAKLPRREGFVCPCCKTAPPLGERWVCGNCGQAFDIFQTQTVCPHCAAQYSQVRCLDCGRTHSMSEWTVPVFVMPKA